MYWITSVVTIRKMLSLRRFCGRLTNWPEVYHQLPIKCFTVIILQLKYFHAHSMCGPNRFRCVNTRRQTLYYKQNAFRERFAASYGLSFGQFSRKKIYGWSSQCKRYELFIFSVFVIKTLGVVRSFNVNMIVRASVIHTLWLLLLQGECQEKYVGY